MSQNRPPSEKLSPEELVIKRVDEVNTSEKEFLLKVAGLAMYRPGFGDSQSRVAQMLDTMQRMAAALLNKYPEGTSWLSMPGKDGAPYIIDAEKARAYLQDVRMLVKLSKALTSDSQLLDELKKSANTAFQNEPQKAQKLCDIPIMGVQRSMRYSMLLDALSDATQQLPNSQSKQDVMLPLAQTRETMLEFASQSNKVSHQSFRSMMHRANEAISNIKKSPPDFNETPPGLRQSNTAQPASYGQFMNQLWTKIANYDGGLRQERRDGMMDLLRYNWLATKDVPASVKHLKVIFQRELESVNADKNSFQRLHEGDYTKMLKSVIADLDTYSKTAMLKTEPKRESVISPSIAKQPEKAPVITGPALPVKMRRSNPVRII